ncbi:MAG: hypothetical protein HQ536_05210 [Parcubacteria group bacterium]|nr:hypothetical protein [Parcubacteria group bacterium]
MEKYKCDICDTEGKGYFGYNSTYGYCDNPECKEKADGYLSNEINEAVELGDFQLAECLAGDACPSSYL